MNGDIPRLKKTDPVTYEYIRQLEGLCSDFRVIVEASIEEILLRCGGATVPPHREPMIELNTRSWTNQPKKTGHGFGFRFVKSGNVVCSWRTHPLCVEKIWYIICKWLGEGRR